MRDHCTRCDELLVIRFFFGEPRFVCPRCPAPRAYTSSGTGPLPARSTTAIFYRVQG